MYTTITKIIPAILLFITWSLLSGCVHSQSTAVSTTISAQAMNNNHKEDRSDKQFQASEPADFLTGDQFKQNSDLIIKNFELAYDKQTQAMTYHIEYKLGLDAITFIRSGQHPYYFRLEAPEKWRSSFTSAQSAETAGAKLSGDSENIYTVDMSIPLQHEATDQTIQKLVNDPYDYVLYLYENPAFPARIVGNVYGSINNPS
ncbi:hypothetical protein L2089_06110 [Paenibacillus hunanensis]|uniref:hypothetical protein n=1 Tax=Paenibacillus hunanensis TaxID=539262 RepID=UPI00202618BC|nr:hypothetical protein [Paenibacillus hunanensis]MCL9660252.1 hypothetical protein [Paenibacillus hunanensis]